MSVTFSSFAVAVACYDALMKEKPTLINSMSQFSPLSRLASSVSSASAAGTQLLSSKTKRTTMPLRELFHIQPSFAYSEGLLEATGADGVEEPCGCPGQDAWDEPDVVSHEYSAVIVGDPAQRLPSPDAPPHEDIILEHDWVDEYDLEEMSAGPPPDPLPSSTSTTTNVVITTTDNDEDGFVEIFEEASTGEPASRQLCGAAEKDDPWQVLAVTSGMGSESNSNIDFSGAIGREGQRLQLLPRSLPVNSVDSAGVVEKESAKDGLYKAPRGTGAVPTSAVLGRGRSGSGGSNGHSGKLSKDKTHLRAGSTNHYSKPVEENKSRNMFDAINGSSDDEDEEECAENAQES